jgi:hypothetical protein
MMLRKIDIRRSWQLAREQFAAVASERDLLRWQLKLAEQSVRELREALQQLSAAVAERQHAEAELARLYREREILRASALERDPAAPLQ